MRSSYERYRADRSQPVRTKQNTASYANSDSLSYLIDPSPWVERLVYVAVPARAARSGARAASGTQRDTTGRGPRGRERSKARSETLSICELEDE
ncbi:hypothetical protein [Pontibacter rugosus]|uniref:Uncharacterized protein n=1 Tax=Pontibacter rugosus TaxID=1745966 RepID=A0ABW3SMX8_9BACT